MSSGGESKNDCADENGTDGIEENDGSSNILELNASYNDEELLNENSDDDVYECENVDVRKIQNIREWPDSQPNEKLESLLNLTGDTFPYLNIIFTSSSSHHHHHIIYLHIIIFTSSSLRYFIIIQ